MADHLSTKERSVSSSPGRKNSRFEKSEEKRNYEGHVQRRYSSHKGSSSPTRRSRQSSSSRKRKVHHRRPVSQQRSSPDESEISRNGYNSYPERERSHREKHRARSRSPLRRDERQRPARRSRNSSRSSWHRYDRQSSGRRSRSRSRSPLRHYQHYSRRYSPVRRHTHRNSLRDERDIRPRYETYDEKTLKEEIKELLRIEHHHLIDEGYEDSNGDTQGVEWCYKYLDPNIRGHITGGKALLHHRCRQCNRICLHLLGKYGTGKRMCLECAAREREWREEDVPSWYFHNIKQCRHCTPGYGYYYD